MCCSRQIRRRDVPRKLLFFITLAVLVLKLSSSPQYMMCASSLSPSSNPLMPMPRPPPHFASYQLYSTILQRRRQSLASTEQERGSNNIKSSLTAAIPLAGVHDALSAKIFARHGAPALFVSGFGISASLLGIPDAGMTNLVEMEMMTRHIHAAVRDVCSDTTSTNRDENTPPPPPIIVDGDTGHGGASNMMRTITALSNAGAAAITIEDQIFPKKCTVAAGSKIQIVQREEAIERVKGAIGARDLFYEQRRSHQTTNNYNDEDSSWSSSKGKGTWIIARTDCRLAFGFNEVIERCLKFEELGAEIIYAENLQSVDEYQQLRDRLDARTVTMIAQVQESSFNVHDDELRRFNNVFGGGGRKKKPLLTVQEIGELGYDLALFGVTPLQCVVGVLDEAARQFLGSSSADDDDDDDGGVASGLIGTRGNTKEWKGRLFPMADFSHVKRVVGFDRLERFETEFPCA